MEANNMERSKICRRYLMEVSEFVKQFYDLKQDESFIYHRGNLARDRKDSVVISEIADRALKLGTDCNTPVRRYYFGNIKPSKESLGVGMAVLTQRKICSNSHWSQNYVYEYIIKRRVLVKS